MKFVNISQKNETIIVFLFFWLFLSNVVVAETIQPINNIVSITFPFQPKAIDTQINTSFLAVNQADDNNHKQVFFAGYAKMNWLIRLIFQRFPELVIMYSDNRLYEKLKETFPNTEINVAPTVYNGFPGFYFDVSGSISFSLLPLNENEAIKNLNYFKGLVLLIEGDLYVFYTISHSSEQLVAQENTSHFFNSIQTSYIRTPGNLAEQLDTIGGWVEKIVGTLILLSLLLVIMVIVLIIRRKKKQQ